MRAGWLILILAIASAAAPAADPALPRSAVVAILPPGKGYAPAACVDVRGLFVLASPLDRDASLQLLLGDRKAGATIVRAGDDLTLAQARESELPPPAALAGEPAEGAAVSVIACGTPAGLDPPPLLVHAARITAIHKAREAVERFDLDLAPNATLPGSLIYDAEGALVGAVVSADRVVRALPARVIARFLEAPEIDCDPPTVAWMQRHQPLDLSLRVITWRGDAGRFTAQVAFAGRKPTPAPVRSDGACRIRITPIAPPEGGVRLAAEIAYPAGVIRCRLEDQALKLDGQELRLGMVQRIERRPEGVRVDLADGTRREGRALGMPALRADLGGYGMEIDTFRATTIRIEHPAPDVDRVEGEVRVLAGEAVVARRPVVIRLAPPAPATRPATQPAPAAPVAARIARTTIEVAAPAGLRAHARARGRIEPGDVDGEFNVPRAVRPMGDAAPGDAWVEVRLVNEGTKPLASARIAVECQFDGEAEPRRAEAKVAAPAGGLGAGEAGSIRVPVPAPGSRRARIRVSILEAQRAQ